MSHRLILAIVLIMNCATFGCRAEVKSTEDSVKVGAELPKVEVKETPDLDPATDHDVDIKTPNGNQ
jgi:hypothetical protein